MDLPGVTSSPTSQPVAAEPAAEKTRLALGAGVAQLVEHFIRNEGVPGSSPGAGLVNSATRRLDGAGQRGRDPERPGTRSAAVTSRRRPRRRRPVGRVRRARDSLPWGGTYHGPEGFADFLASRRRATSTKFEADAGEGPRRRRQPRRRGRAAHRPHEGRPATSRTRSVWLYQLRDGQIIDAATPSPTPPVLARRTRLIRLSVVIVTHNCRAEVRALASRRSPRSFATATS